LSAKDRIGFRTQANANILNILGDLVSSDGIQAVRVPMGIPGQVLIVDLATETGLSWVTPAAGTVYTASDGITLTVANFTNDLVTGTMVAELDVQATGDAVINVPATGGIVLDATTGSTAPVAGTINLVSPVAVDITSTDVVVIADGGGLVLSTDPLSTPSPGEVDLFADTLLNGVGSTGVTFTSLAGGMILTGADTVDVNANTGNITLQAGATDNSGSVFINAGSTAGQVKLLGRKIDLTGTGLDIDIDGDVASVNIFADLNVKVDGTIETQIRSDGTVHIQTITTDTIKLYDGAGTAQWTPIADATGGTVIDAEVRTAVNALLAQLRLRGDLDI